MAQPLRSNDPNPKNISFSHFGVLDDGKRSTGAALVSIFTNLLIAGIIVFLGYVVKTNPTVAKEVAVLTLPPKPPEVQPVPKPPPPPPLKPLPTPKVILHPPKIVPPPTPEKPPDVKPIPVPIPKPVVSEPAPPKIIKPPAAVKVNLATAAAAHVPNNDAHPTAVRLGQADNPLKPMTGPAVSRVNLGGQGIPGMNASNTGSGPHATSVSLGSGCPNCSSINGRDNASRAVRGVKLGTPGSNGPLNSTNYSNAPRQVQLQTAAAPPAVNTPQIRSSAAATPPRVTYKPTPVYTAEAKSLHLEGNVSVRIRVTASGAVQVLAVTSGLGHGLDESARQAVMGTRFQPAKDASGNPVDWEGVVKVNFQMS
ncbi:MAG TPA: energy transducer TonB [Granulicella sp.]|jgi:TonB family protein